MTGNHTIRVLLAQGAGRLAQVSATPHLDAELLLAHAIGANRTRIKSCPEELADAAAVTRYASLLERRASGVPLAYIVGFKDFWTLRLAVTPAVLVPRPETELLVERALALHPEPSARVVDLGTGSGAIALALASERATWHVTATDVSADALAVARTNAAALGLTGVEFLHGSWFEPLAGSRFDLIVTNPPYVAADDPALQHPPLCHEPFIALAPQADAMACISAIVLLAPLHLGRGGWLLLEHGATQAEAVSRELVVRGFRHVRSHCDLAGHERMTEARWLG